MEFVEPAAIGVADARQLARPRTALLLTALSGFAGLGYEIVWTQQLGIWLGHEFVAVLAVLAAFFGGLALGAQAFAGRIERSARPGLWYAACEAAIAGWALVLTAVLPTAAAWLAARIGAQPGVSWHWTVAFLGPFVLLLPACCAMGVTLPALERAIARGSREGFAIGALYAANTAGAVLGVLTSTFLLVPGLGLANTARACAALNALCGAIAFGAWRAQRCPVRSPRAVRGGDRKLLGLLCATGALGVGYEVLVVRVLGQITQNTVYSFAILLAVYLLGSAAGGALYQRWLAPRAETVRMREPLLLGTAGACLSGVLALALEAALGPAWFRVPLAGPGGVPCALLGEATLAVGAFLIPALAMGALFSELCVEARLAGLGWGPAMASNTLGAALAPLLFAVLLLPSLGPKSALLCVALGYLLLVRPGAWRRVRFALPAAAVAAAALLLGVRAGPLAVVDVPDGGRLVLHEEGVGAAVSVVEAADGVATLRINNRPQEGSSATLLSDARLAWLPLLLHAHPRSALFLGLGTGVTAGSAAWDPELQVDAVELLPEVVAAAAQFSGVLESERAPRVLVADARRYVRAAGPRYDVIVADLFHPARAGAGALYTVEHFAAVGARLAPGGLFCQWLPLHQLDLATLRSIVGAFLESYPDARALLATNSLDTPVLGLVAQPGGDGFATAAVQQRLTHAAGPARLGALHVEDEYAVLGSFIAGPRELRRFAAGARLNTDDRPVVAYRAPFMTYAPDSGARERLLDLLHSLQLQPEDVLSPEALKHGPQVARLAAYWAARDRFIELGMRVRPSGDARDMVAQLRAPLLEILRASPDFRPAYDPLLRMAAALTGSDAGAARALLADLSAAQPARGEAGRLLQRLVSEAGP